ncbi:MAG: hypothetical protein ACRDA4_05025 [Filifactoraceae bacterium]
MIATIVSIVTFMTLVIIYFILGNNIEVVIDGNKRKFSSLEEINDYIDKSFPQNLIIKNSIDNNKSVEIPLKNLGATYLDEYNLELINRYSNRDMSTKVKDFYFPSKSGNRDIILKKSLIFYNPNEVWNFIVNNMEKLNYKPKDAYIHEINEKLVIENEENGLAFDVYNLFDVIKKSLKSGNITGIEVKGYLVEANIKSENLKKYKRIVARGSLEIQSKHFSNNIIEILVENLNNTVIKGDRQIEIKANFYSYLTSILNGKFFSEEEEKLIYKFADQIFDIVKNALLDGNCHVKYDKSTNSMKVYTDKGKEVIVSSYLEMDQVKILIVSVE